MNWKFLFTGLTLLGAFSTAMAEFDRPQTQRFFRKHHKAQPIVPQPNDLKDPETPCDARMKLAAYEQVAKDLKLSKKAVGRIRLDDFKQGSWTEAVADNVGSADVTVSYLPVFPKGGTRRIVIRTYTVHAKQIGTSTDCSVTRVVPAQEHGPAPDAGGKTVLACGKGEPLPFVIEKETLKSTPKSIEIYEGKLTLPPHTFGTVNLRCLRTRSEPPPGSADMIMPIWSCTGTNTWHAVDVKVETGGIAGLTTARVTIRVPPAAHPHRRQRVTHQTQFNDCR